jgi:hypothetical protein
MTKNARTLDQWFKERVSAAFEWWISGIKGIVTIPLTILIILFFFFPSWRDAFSRSYEDISDLVNPKTYITRDELDVINEWVILVWSYEEKESAVKDFGSFVSSYSTFGDKSRIRDIHLVRSDRKRDVWMIVIDWGGGKGSSRLSEEGIKIIKSEYDLSGSDSLSRAIKNNLGEFFADAHAHYYDQKSFEYNNGDIVNLNNRILLKK